MSKGLGIDYVKKYGEFHRNNLQFARYANGKTYALPRYYSDKIFREIKDSKEYRNEKEKQIERRLKQLIERYEGLLKSEINEAKKDKLRKYIEKFKSLNELKKL